MNSKNRKIIIVLVLALIVSLAGSFLLYTYLTPQKTTVYVFNNNFETGTIVTESMLTAVQCDSNILVAGAKAGTGSQFVTGGSLKTVLNTGDTLRMDVSAGMPLTTAMLSVNGGTSIEMSMDPSKIAVTIPVNNATGVSNGLREGSRVNVYSVNDIGAVLILQNMRVLAVKSGDEVRNVTIEVTADQSLRLIYYIANSTIYLGLVDNGGYDYVEDMSSYGKAQ